MILIVDFGSQTTHLIGRRIKELGAAVQIVTPESVLSTIQKEKPSGIILSGGPSSVYESGSPTIDKKIFDLKIPVLAICYGFQLTAHLLGGKVLFGRKEYGPARLEILNLKSQISNSLPKKFTVWMSHGDDIVFLPSGFIVFGSTEHVSFALATDEERKIFGLLFHPEVEHTEYGRHILANFIRICGSSVKEHKIDVEQIIAEIKEKVGDNYVIGAVSGGVDSTVAGVLAASAIGDKFIPVYVDNGLMRQGTTEHVKKIFTKTAGINPIVIDAVGETLENLRGIADPEEKRKVIGNLYITIFEHQAEKLAKSGKSTKFLMQGTIYSDVIESQGSKHAAKIKSHHNVGGLPERMKLQLLEPLRGLYKDEVRTLGKSLGLPDEFVHKQPFPGPGFAVRIRGEVTKERLEKEKKADVIVLEELEKAGLLASIFISFPVMTNAFSTAVKGDGQFFGEVIALRVVESQDVMTATWARLPYEVLQKISSRIVNEVSGISRVVYDISTKPPATMEWE
ncbi:MAG: glutamine-hydrolyzing GMP synthase [Candidatus Levyibacteriota bacterium]|nr:MAG: glutamine-hydrolyzing GMP synthase [Candidatus Levybacteria bacterium]